MQKSVLVQPGGETVIELTEEVMKRAERFLRKVTPLVEKQLEENLPLYGRTLLISKVLANNRENRHLNEIQGQFILYKTKNLDYRSWKLLQSLGMPQAQQLQQAMLGLIMRQHVLINQWCACGESSKETLNRHAHRQSQFQ